MTKPDGPVHFLLVDDLPENLLSLEALLKRDDVVLLKARSGDEALELLLVHDVALALLDVQMPGMDGFELAEFMRGSERTRHIPIIFVTAGSADAQRRFRGYEAGAVDFIQKPIEADILRSKAEVFRDLCLQRRQIVAQRDELEVAGQALIEADRRKDEFLAMLGHELRNPVAALGGGLRLLKRYPSTEPADAIREKMECQLVHLSRLVEDLLDISRISEGKISLRKETCDLAAIVQSAIEACQANLDNADHEFAVDLPAEPIELCVDPTRITQVLTNLLNNAAKYTPTGGHIGLSAEKLPGEVRIRVTDDGIGIPAEMQAQIFEIFAQVEGHRIRARGGLGVGLALVRQIMALHGGTVAVVSEGSGKGSTFTITIPLQA